MEEENDAKNVFKTTVIWGGEAFMAGKINKPGNILLSAVINTPTPIGLSARYYTPL